MAFQQILTNILKEFELRTIRQMQYKAQQYKRKIMKDMIGLLCIFASILFLAIAFTYFLIESLALSATLSFLIVGIMFFLVGIIIKIAR